jgi:hypothetical protein
MPVGCGQKVQVSCEKVATAIRMGAGTVLEGDCAIALRPAHKQRAMTVENLDFITLPFKPRNLREQFHLFHDSDIGCGLDAPYYLHKNPCQEGKDLPSG